MTHVMQCMEQTRTQKRTLEADNSQESSKHIKPTQTQTSRTPSVDKISQKPAAASNQSAEDIQRKRFFALIEKADVAGLRRTLRKHPDAITIVNLSSQDEAPIFAAVRKGSLELIKLLFECGGNRDARALYQRTLLQAAAGSNHPEIIRYLVAEGADVNTPDAMGDTPMHEAAYYGNTEAIDCLFKLKAGLEKRNNEGQTPLHRASMYDRNNPTCACLMQLGANIHARDNDGKMAVHYAAENKNSIFLGYLYHRGANLKAPDKAGLLPRECTTDVDTQACIDHLLSIKKS